MRDASLSFLKELVNTPSPTGYESRGQRVWLDYVKSFAEVWTKPTATNQNPALTAPAEIANQAHPVTANGAPSNATTVTTPDVPIYKRTREQQDALAREMGPSKFVERHMRELRERNVRVRG